MSSPPTPPSPIPPLELLPGSYRKPKVVTKNLTTDLLLGYIPLLSIAKNFKAGTRGSIPSYFNDFRKINLWLLTFSDIPLISMEVTDPHMANLLLQRKFQIPTNALYCPPMLTPRTAFDPLYVYEYEDKEPEVIREAIARNDNPNKHNDPWLVILVANKQFILSFSPLESRTPDCKLYTANCGFIVKMEYGLMLTYKAKGRGAWAIALGACITTMSAGNFHNRNDVDYYYNFLRNFVHHDVETISIKYHLLAKHVAKTILAGDVNTKHELFNDSRYAILSSLGSQYLGSFSLCINLNHEPKRAIILAQGIKGKLNDRDVRTTTRPTKTLSINLPKYYPYREKIKVNRLNLSNSFYCNSSSIFGDYSTNSSFQIRGFETYGAGYYTFMSTKTRRELGLMPNDIRDKTSCPYHPNGFRTEPDTWHTRDKQLNCTCFQQFTGTNPLKAISATDTSYTYKSMTADEISNYDYTNICILSMSNGIGLRRIQLDSILTTTKGTVVTTLSILEMLHIVLNLEDYLMYLFIKNKDNSYVYPDNLMEALFQKCITVMQNNSIPNPIQTYLDVTGTMAELDPHIPPVLTYGGNTVANQDHLLEHLTGYRDQRDEKALTTRRINPSLYV
jgi:hypothetical protein